MDPPAPDTLGRITRLEWVLDSVEKRSSKNSERLDVVEKQDATTAQQILEVRDDVKTLKTSLDRLTWAIVGMALTIATGAIGLALQQILSHQGTP